MRRTGKRASVPAISTPTTGGGWKTQSDMACFSWFSGNWISVISTVFAPQAELLLGDAVGVAEDHGIGFGVVGDPLPARRHEDVLRAPGESLAVDDGSAAALDDGEHGGVRAAIGCRLEALGQELHEGGDGRHGRAATDRVDVAHLETVAGVPGLTPAHGLQGLAGPCIGIVEDRGGRPAGLVVHGQQVSAVAGERIALRPRDRLFVFRMAFGERRVEERDYRYVEPTEP